MNFNHLHAQLKANELDKPWLAEIEWRHNIFPHIDYRVYA